MKDYIHILIVILIFAGCKDTKKAENVESSNTNVDWPFKDVTDNFRYVSAITISHKLSLSCGGEYLPVRKRILNKSEIAMSNSGTEQAKLLNDSIILTYIYNDYPLELIDENEEYYRIRFDYKNQLLDGYILKNYCGSPTIKPYTDLSHSLRSCNLITNPDLLPYCRVFVTEKFHNLLNAGIKSQNPLKHLIKILSETDDELILYSLFVGQSSRELYNNNNRMGSDEEHLFYCIKNEYYTYDFNNWSNMFVVRSPSLPFKIDSYSIKNDTLKLATEDYDNYHSKPSVKLYPQDSKRAFTNRNGAVWILNDTIRLKDISYIADKFSVTESQIGHGYFYEILELYIQEILPKRNDTYLEHYLDFIQGIPIE
jgi:hypothetical protein